MVTAIDPSPQSEGPGPARSVMHTSFLLVLLGFSLALNVVLGWQVRSSKVGPPKHDQSPADSPRLVEGALVAPLTVKKLDGTEQAISFTSSDEPTVLYVFSRTCVWCARNVDTVRALAKATASTHRFIGLSLRDIDNAGLEAEEQKLGFSVWRGLSLDTIKALGLGSTPQTIVVSPQSRVVKNWVGFYGGDLHKDIEAYFGVPLLQMPKTGQVDSPPDSPQSCTRCVLEGLFYSTGATVTTGDRRLRCGADGRWVAF
jgi:hypothetical protein